MRLLDGRFSAIAGSYRKLGELTGKQAAAEELAGYAEQTVKRITDRIADIRRNSDRWFIMRAARAG